MTCGLGRVPGVIDASHPYRPRHMSNTTMANGHSEVTWTPPDDWGNPVGNLVLGASFITHIALVLLALYQARHLRLPRWELARLGLGLVMPLLLIPHVFGTAVL